MGVYFCSYRESHGCGGVFISVGQTASYPHSPKCPAYVKDESAVRERVVTLTVRTELSDEELAGTFKPTGKTNWCLSPPGLMIQTVTENDECVTRHLFALPGREVKVSDPE